MMEEKFVDECADCTITYSDDLADIEEGEGVGEMQNSEKWALGARLKSKVLWSALFGLLIAVFSAFDLWDKLGITSDAFSGILTALGSVLAAFGVLNNPTSTDTF